MAPRIRIPAHVFGYSLAIAPAVAYAMYWKRNHKSDQELEDILKENYSTKIQGNRDKKEEMVKFFAAMKDPTANPDQEKKMQEVLYGGKGDIKRHYAVDEKLYGTQEGVERRKMAEEEQQQQQLKMKKQYNVAKSGNKTKQKKKKQQDDGLEEQNKEAKDNNEHGSSHSSKTGTTTTAAVAVGTVGMLALAAVLVTSSSKR